MLSAFANALTALKERAMEANVKRLINHKIEALGSVTSLQSQYHSFTCGSFSYAEPMRHNSSSVSENNS